MVLELKLLSHLSGQSFGLDSPIMLEYLSFDLMTQSSNSSLFDVLFKSDEMSLWEIPNLNPMAEYVNYVIQSE